MEGLKEFLMFALPGGFLGSLVTWFASRRKRDIDMLEQLQSSINLLSEENRKILEENVQLRRENADLKSNQEEMLLRLTRLTKEVERLRKVISKKTSGDEKNNLAMDTRPVVCAAGRLRSNKAVSATEQPADREPKRSRSRRGTVRTVAAESREENGGIPPPDEVRGDVGGDTGAADAVVDPPAEPP